jgi:hypothetical protein
VYVVVVVGLAIGFKTLFALKVAAGVQEKVSGAVLPEPLPIEARPANCTELPAHNTRSLPAFTTGLVHEVVGQVVE